MAHLLKSQRNDVFKHITLRGLNPSDFTWEIFAHPTFDECETINYLDGYYFEFLYTGESFQWEYSPGEGKIVDKNSPQYGGYSWSEIGDEFDRWLTNIEREISEPDLWANLPVTSDSLWQSTEHEIENSPFTKDEHEIIVQGIQKIRDFVIDTGLANKEIKSLDVKLDYLIKSSNKFGRKDWILLVSGTLLSIVSSLALDSDSAKTLFEIAGKALNQLYQGMLLLPQ